MSASTAAKRKRTGTCRVCGATTRYAGKPGQAVSERCTSCANAEKGQAMVGGGAVQQRILYYCSEPRRYSAIREGLGISNDQLSGTLNRLVAHGLIRRVSRGVYVRVDDD